MVTAGDPTKIYRQPIIHTKAAEGLKRAGAVAGQIPNRGELAGTARPPREATVAPDAKAAAKELQTAANEADITLAQAAIFFSVEINEAE